MIRIKPTYLLWALLLLVIEVLIALYVKDSIIRPYGGDTLVVILIYCTLMGFFPWTKWKVAFGVLLFSFLIETLQYFDFVEMLGLQESKLANVVLGNSFAWEDLVAYSIGCLLILVIEYGKELPPFSRMN